MSLSREPRQTDFCIEFSPDALPARSFGVVSCLTLYGRELTQCSLRNLSSVVPKRDEGWMRYVYPPEAKLCHRWALCALY